MKKLLFLLSTIFVSTYSTPPLNLTIGTTKFNFQDKESNKHHLDCNCIGNGSVPLIVYSTERNCIILSTEESDLLEIPTPYFLKMVSLWEENKLPGKDQYQKKNLQALHTLLLATNNNINNTLIVKSFTAIILAKVTNNAPIKNQSDFDQAWKHVVKQLGGEIE